MSNYPDGYFEQPTEEEYMEAQGEEATCTWTLDDHPDNDVWQTECGNASVFEVGGPKENEFSYCPYCGKPLEARLSTNE